MSNFVFAIVFMSFVGAASYEFLSWGLGTMFVNLGVVTGNQSYFGMVTLLSNPFLGFGVGLCFLILASVVSLWGIRPTYKLLFVTFVIMAVALLAYFVALISAGPAGFQAGFNKLSGANYNAIIVAADKAGFITTFTTQGAILGSVWTFFSYAGFSSSVYVAGEIKRNEPAQLYGIIGGAVIFALVMYGTYAISYYVMGAQFLNAAALLAGSGNAVYTLPSSPVGQFLVIFANPSPVIAVLLPVGLMAGAVAGVVVLFPIVTRCVFAWSFDRVIPMKFSEVTKRGAPTYSIVLACAVAVVFLAGSFWTTFTSLLLYVIASYWVNVAIVGVAAMLFPFRRKDLFNNSVAVARKKVGGVPIITILGLGTLITGIALAIASINPTYSGAPLSVPLLFVQVFLFGMGLVIYYLSVFIRKRQGIDLPSTFREMPPE
jgi:amino acid transporter